MKKFSIFAIAFLLIASIPTMVCASQIMGGDAANQASADDILDIIFLIDTSGSMTDDISAIGSVAASVIQNLDCPDCDIWTRATFAGISRSYGSVFDEAFTGPNVNSSEDNGGAALDAINSASGTWWVDDSTASQDYYRAVVTIGDEGTENGYPVNQDDWDIAYTANQAAISQGVFLFSWVTNDPYSGVVNLFETMAMGGSGGGYTFGNAGGGFINDQAGTGNVEVTLENIICAAGSGGEPPPTSVPEPATVFLLGFGMVCLGAVGRKRIKK